MMQKSSKTGKTYRKPPPESALTHARRNFLTRIWTQFYAPVFRFYAMKLEEFLPTKFPTMTYTMALLPGTVVYAFLHKGEVIRVHSGCDPEDLRDYPSNDLTVVRTDVTVPPEDMARFETALLGYVDLYQEYLTVINFFRGFVLFPIANNHLTDDSPLGETIARKMSNNLKTLYLAGDPKERTPLTETILTEFIKDHDTILNHFADRILENVLLGALLHD